MQAVDLDGWDAKPARMLHPVVAKTVKRRLKRQLQQKQNGTNMQYKTVWSTCNAVPTPLFSIKK